MSRILTVMMTFVEDLNVPDNILNKIYTRQHPIGNRKDKRQSITYKFGKDT